MNQEKNRGQRFFGKASGWPNGGAEINRKVVAAEGGDDRLEAPSCAINAILTFLAGCQVYSYVEIRVWCRKRPINRYPDNQKVVLSLIGLFREGKCGPRVGGIPDSPKRDDVSRRGCHFVAKYLSRIFSLKLNIL